MSRTCTRCKERDHCWKAVRLSARSRKSLATSLMRLRESNVPSHQHRRESARELRRNGKEGGAEKEKGSQADSPVVKGQRLSPRGVARTDLSGRRRESLLCRPRLERARGESCVVLSRDVVRVTCERAYGRERQRPARERVARQSQVPQACRSRLQGPSPPGLYGY